MNKDLANFEERLVHEPIHEQLRRQRMNAGIELDDVAKNTGIQPEFLQAIELGEVETLPPGLYRRNFIRAYLGAIGIEDKGKVEEIVNQFVGSSWQPMLTDLGAPEESMPERRPFSLALAAIGVAVAIALGLLGYLGWTHRSAVHDAAPDAVAIGKVDWPEPGLAPALVAAEPVVAAVAAEEEPGAGAAPSGDAGQRQNEAGAALPGDAGQRQNEAGTTPPGDAGQGQNEVGAALPGDAGQGQNEAGAAPPGDAGQGQNEAIAYLLATEEVWLRVSPKTGPSKEYLLKKGERLELDLSEPIRLLIGNAGGLKVTVGGQNLPLGESGKVRKLLLDAEDISGLTGA